MLTYDDTTFGIQKCKLNLAKLYPDHDERAAFFARFEEFLASDRCNEELFSLRGNILKYRSEVFVSDKVDSRPPVLLIVGNPASHSVEAGMCYAYEGNGREHRFWRLLEESGFLIFWSQSSLIADLEERIDVMRKDLYELAYESPFRIGIAVFYSIPSPASGDWSGASGVRKLLGTKAFRKITVQEEKRIDGLVSRFLGQCGIIIAFQKDAYENLRSPGDLGYERALADQGRLQGRYKVNPSVFLAGAPPTRLGYARCTQLAMVRYRDWLCREFATNQ